LEVAVAVKDWPAKRTWRLTERWMTTFGDAEAAGATPSDPSTAIRIVDPNDASLFIRDNARGCRCSATPLGNEFILPGAARQNRTEDLLSGFGPWGSPERT